MGTEDERVAPAEYQFCSHCRDGAVFEWSEEEKDWMSVCCWSRPIPLDVEPSHE